MSMSESRPTDFIRPGAHRPIVGSKRHRGERTATAVCALVAGASHIPLISEHLHEAPYIGWSFIALVIGSVTVALGLLLRDSRRVWALAAVLFGAAVLAYLVSRTIGLPQIPDDVGNWTEAESFPALTAETVAVILSVRALADRGSASGTTLARGFPSENSHGAAQRREVGGLTRRR